MKFGAADRNENLIVFLAVFLYFPTGCGLDIRTRFSLFHWRRNTIIVQNGIDFFVAGFPDFFL